MAAHNKRPALRFTGFHEDWEERTLGEIAEHITEKNIAIQVEETFTNSAELGIVSQKDFFDHSISNFNNLYRYYIVKSNDFIYNPRISNNAPVGPVNINKLNKTGVVSPLYTVFRNHALNNNFLEWYFKSSKWHGFMQFNGDTGARSDRFSIKDNIFFRMPISYPISKEQKFIGKLFAKIHYILTQQEKLYTTLINLKDAMLEKMFPQNGAAVPEIRFADFSTPWKRRNFGDIFTFLSHTPFTREELNYQKGTIKCIHYGDILISFGNIFSPKKDIAPYINTPLKTSTKTNSLTDGDIVFTDAAEDTMVGKCIELSDMDGESIISGLHTIPCRPQYSFSPFFLG